MIKKVRLKNFKSHKDTTLDFSNLTVLCGSNGVGKSSAIQALLLLRESFLSGSKFEYLNLKTNPINIGTAQDAYYQFAQSEEIEIDLITDVQELNYKFQIVLSELSKTIIKKCKDTVHINTPEILESENLFIKTCQYISAARLGPQPVHAKDDLVVEIQNQISVKEGRAEYFLHYLMHNANKTVLPALINDELKEADDLFYQTSAWEKKISAGVNIDVDDLNDLGYSLNYRFSTNTSEGKTAAFRSMNVGFGLSYVMPIIVAILSAPEGALIFIENPEAHIHPHGQSKLAELICLAAQAGVQMVVETHSDHIINGILVQCKKFEEDISKGINKNNVSLYHFDRNEEEHTTVAKKITIESEGTITYAPDGFFDQFTIDRKFLMGF